MDNTEGRLKTLQHIRENTINDVDKKEPFQTVVEPL